MRIEAPTKISDLKGEDLKELQELLARLGLYPSTQIDGVYGRNTQVAWEKFKESRYLNDLDLIGPSSYSLLVKADKEQPILIARPQFDRIFRYARQSDRDKYFMPINRTCIEFEINTLRRLAAFLAQVSHESGSLRYSEEIASGIDYEGRKDLGNLHKGDGIKYKGGGLIQLTGRANYKKAGIALGLPLEERPEMVRNDPFVSARVAGLFWSWKNLNTLADQNSIAAYRSISRKINGGYNGLEDRLKRWDWAKEILGC